MKKLREPVAVTLFFLCATAYFTWPLLPRLGSGLSDSPDSLLNFWALSWSFHVLPMDIFALFDANIFFPRPHTLAYSEHLFGVTLLAWPFYVASGNAVLAYNAALYLTFVLSGVGMYFLARELSASVTAGLVAGTIYAFAPYRFLHVLQIQLLSAQWFPFVFLFLIRFLRGGSVRSLVAASAFALLQVLSCNYYALYLGLAVVLFAAVHARELARDRRKLALAGFAAAAVGGVALPFFLPYQANRTEQGFYRRYEDVVHFSAKPSDYLRPSAFNSSFYQRVLPAQERSEKALFPGFLVLALAGIGLVRGDRKTALYAGTLAAASFVLSLGPELSVDGNTYYLPYRLFYRYVPGYNGLRVPARLGVLVLFGVAILAGPGASWLLSKLSRARPVGGALLLGLTLGEYHTSSLARIFPPAPESPVVYHWLSQKEGDFAVLELPMH